MEEKKLKKISHIFPVIGKWPRFAKFALAKYLFKKRNGYLYDFYEPKNFIEKIWTYTILYEIPNAENYIDKYVFKKTISNILGSESYVIPVYGVYSNIEELKKDWDNLPQEFYIKSTITGNGRNMELIRNKDTVNSEEVFNEVKKWFNPHNTLINSLDRSYRNLKPRVIAEKYMHDLDSESLRDYKFYCFNGEPYCLHTRSFDKKTSEFPRTFFDMNWKKIDATISNHPAASNVDKPIHFEEMKKIASVLSKGFPFARIDFYDTANNPIVGEVTLGYPSSDIKPMDFNYELGMKIEIPKQDLLQNHLFLA